MAYPIPVPPEMEQALTLCSDEELQGLISQAWREPTFDAAAAQWIELVVRYELQLRQVEPWWRKASRFYSRNREAFALARSLLLAFGAGMAGAAAFDYFDA